MKFKILSILFVVSFLLFSCSDDDSTNVKTSDNIKIYTVSPSSLYNYQVMVIKGAGFGALKSGTYADFGGVKQSDEKAYLNWTDNEISVIIPGNAASGSVKLVTKDNSASNSVSYTVLTASQNIPVISSLSSTELSPYETVQLKGKNFGSEQAESYINFNGIIAANYTNWTDSLVTVVVPKDWTNGNLSIAVKGRKSNDISITNAQEITIPSISSLSSYSFKVGDEVVINGTNFGSNLSKGQVIFNNVTATEISNWIDNKIIVKVPANATSGKIYVKVGNLLSSGIDYTVIFTNQPVISNIDLNIAQEGQTITISGSDFGQTRNNSYVTFGGVSAVDYTSWSDTKISVKVPTGAKSGLLNVVVGSATSNGVNFTVQSLYHLLDLCLVQSGKFKMGSISADDMEAYPQHDVTISKSFYVSKYEITQNQYKKVMNSTNPSNPLQYGDNKPVNQVTWLQAVQFCNNLSKMENLTPCYTISGNSVTCNFNADGYRLPTEAEWEYAAKGGINAWTYGQLDNIAWNAENSGNFLQDVGKKTPNAFGLYDMIGNAFEWCWDIYDSQYYAHSPSTDPKGPNSGNDRVYRGGAFDETSTCNSVLRQSGSSDGILNFDLGFRVVRNK